MNIYYFNDLDDYDIYNPSYYLDTIKDIFIYEKNEEELNKYINKINDYELFLQDIYITIKRKYEIPPIEWLVNKK